MRIRWIDQYKGFLGLLVVIGHTMSWSHAMKAYYVLNLVNFIICSFHMPAFFVVSGWVSSTNYDLLRVVKKTVNLAVPLCIFWGINVCLSYMSSYYTFWGAVVKATENYWFVFVMITIVIIYPCLRKINPGGVCLGLLLLATLLTGFIQSKVSMFFGYMLCYAVGDIVGKQTLGQWGKISKSKIIFVLFAIVIIIIDGYYTIFEYSLLVNPYYKIFIGILLSFLTLLVFMDIKVSSIFARAGNVTLEMYLMQFVMFSLFSNLTVGNDKLLTILSFTLMTGISFFLPIWLKRRFGDTKVYTAIFSPAIYVFQLFDKKLRRGEP